MNKANEHKSADIFSKVGSVFAILIVATLLASCAGLFTFVCGAFLKIIGAVKWAWKSVWLPFLIPFGLEAATTIAAMVAIVVMRWLEDRENAKENSD